MLCHTDLSKGSFPNPVADPVELLRGDDRFTQFMQLLDNQCDYLLLVLK